MVWVIPEIDLINVKINYIADQSMPAFTPHRHTLVSPARLSCLKRGRKTYKESGNCMHNTIAASNSVWHIMIERN